MGEPSGPFVAFVQGSLGLPKVTLGRPGRCRFCGTRDEGAFRNVAHTVPEALGNRWIVSADECDGCNHRFARFDDALAKSVGAVLTIGGTRGKNNKVRQTGRSGGPAVIRHGRDGSGRRRISVEVHDSPLERHLAMNSSTRTIRLTTPVAPERFSPRLAYKALVKAALAILPETELPRFSKLHGWLMGNDEDGSVRNLSVGLSLGSVGNAPELVGAAVVEFQWGDGSPGRTFGLSVGSVCLQTILFDDAHWPPRAGVTSGIKWRNVIEGDGQQLVIDYGRPTQLDWSSPELETSPIEAIVTEFNVATGQGSFTPLLRRPGPNPRSDASA